MRDPFSAAGENAAASQIDGPRPLPFTIGILANLTGSRRPDQALRQRRFVSVTAGNVEDVLSAMRPKIEIDADVRLTFSVFADFEPENVARQIERIRVLADTRQELLNLRALETPRFASALREIVEAHQEAAVTNEDIAARIERACIVEEYERDTLVRWVRTYLNAALESGTPEIAALIARLAECISAQLEPVLNDAAFVRLSETWQRLRSLSEAAAAMPGLALRALNVTPNELRRDLLTHAEPEESRLERLVHLQELGTFGGEPFGAIVLDSELTRRWEDIELLSLTAEVCARAAAVFVAAVSPRFFGVERFEESPEIGALLESDLFLRFQAFRRTESAVFTGVAVGVAAAWDSALRLAAAQQSRPAPAPCTCSAGELPAPAASSLAQAGFLVAGRPIEEACAIAVAPGAVRLVEVLRAARTLHEVFTLVRFRAESFSTAEDWSAFLAQETRAAADLEARGPFGSLELVLGGRVNIRRPLSIHSWRVMANEAVKAAAAGSGASLIVHQVWPANRWGWY